WERIEPGRTIGQVDAAGDTYGGWTCDCALASVSRRGRGWSGAGMNRYVIAALHTIGEALDMGAAEELADLRCTLMTLGSYGQRRDLAVDCAASGRRRRAKEVLVEAERWYARLPRAARWRGDRTPGRSQVQSALGRVTESHGPGRSTRPSKDDGQAEYAPH